MWFSEAHPSADCFRSTFGFLCRGSVPYSHIPKSVGGVAVLIVKWITAELARIGINGVSVFPQRRQSIGTPARIEPQ
jgi:hypothetical protein